MLAIPLLDEYSQRAAMVSRKRALRMLLLKATQIIKGTDKASSPYPVSFTVKDIGIDSVVIVVHSLAALRKSIHCHEINGRIIPPQPARDQSGL